MNQLSTPASILISGPHNVVISIFLSGLLSNIYVAKILFRFLPEHGRSLLFVCEDSSNASLSKIDPEELPSGSKDYQFLYFGTSDVNRLRGTGYELLFEETAAIKLSGTDLQNMVAAAYKRVETALEAPIKDDIRIVVVKQLKHKKDAKNALAIRFTSKAKKSNLVAEAHGLSVSTLAHELGHHWMRGYEGTSRRKIDEWALEEGICEYLESMEEIHEAHWNYLAKHDPLTPEEVRSSDKNRKTKAVRATVWVQVYWLLHVAKDKRTLADVARMQIADLPDAKTAVNELRARD